MFATILWKAHIIDTSIYLRLQNNILQIYYLAVYDTIGGRGPTGADIGGRGANCEDEIEVVDWSADCDTDTEDDAINNNGWNAFIIIFLKIPFDIIVSPKLV